MPRLILGISLSLLHLAVTLLIGLEVLASGLGGPASFDFGQVFHVLSFPLGWVCPHIILLIINSFVWGYGIAAIVCLAFRGAKTAN